MIAASGEIIALPASAIVRLLDDDCSMVIGTSTLGAVQPGERFTFASRQFEVLT